MHWKFAGSIGVVGYSGILGVVSAYEVRSVWGVTPALPSYRITHAFGTKWTYCGGATALPCRLITKGTGDALHEYARRALFEPMGFGPSE